MVDIDRLIDPCSRLPLPPHPPFSTQNACVNEELVFHGRVWDSLGPAKELLSKLLEPNPAKRLTAEQAISHRWFETSLFAL